MAIDLDPERVLRNPWLAGLVGSVITAWRFTPGVTWPAKVTNSLFGSAIAGYGAPLLAEVTNQPSPHFLSVVALILGLVGMSLCDQLVKAARETKLGQFIADWIDRFSPRKGG